MSVRSTNRNARIKRAEKTVIRAAIGCIDKQGYAFRVATESIARTYFVNERALGRLEGAVATLKEIRRSRK